MGSSTLTAFAVAFGTVFLAELPDKTMVASLVLTTRFRRPLAVWCGVAGAFVMQNLGEEDMKRAIGSLAPGVLFPYARAAISMLVSQGGFPQLLLPPVNFDALFASATSTPEGAPN